MSYWHVGAYASFDLQIKTFPQPLPRRERCGQVEAIDDGETKAAGRHGVALGRMILMKGDLHAGDARHVLDPLNGRGGRMAVAAAMGSDLGSEMRSEQDGA